MPGLNGLFRRTVGTPRTVEATGTPMLASTAVLVFQSICCDCGIYFDQAGNNECKEETGS
jgi:hypothetical protein